MKKYLGIDVGGTNIKYGVLTEDGQLLEKYETPTPMDSLDHYLDTLVSIYQKFPDVEAVVMSAPGRINAETGYLYSGGSLMYIHEFDLREALKDRIPVPISVENDAKCAALAELWQGGLKDVNSGIITALGTGIGGAIVIDKKLYRGSNFAAGEFSAMPTDLRNHFNVNEMWGWNCTVRFLLNRYAELTNSDLGSLDGRTFFGYVNEGDPVALEVLDWYAEILANGIIALQSVLDIERVCVGGGISRQPSLIKAINKRLDIIYSDLPGFFPTIRPEVVACTFGNDANLIGALYHYLFEIKK